MMRVPLNLILVVVAMVLTACETVTSPAPLGDKPLAIEAEDWEGQWSNAEGHLDLSVVDAAKGLVTIEFEEDGTAHTLDLQLREAAGWIFVNVTERDFNQSQGLGEMAIEGNPDTPVSNAYLWARIVNNGDSIIAWSPAPEQFVMLVEKGLLPGHVDEGNMVLGALGHEHYRVMTSGEHGVLLDWENPIVLYRLEPGDNPR